MKRKIEELGHGESRLASGHGAFGDGSVSHAQPTGVRRTKNGNRKPMRWVSTHHHTTYSYGDGFELPEAHFRRAAELQISKVFITEHGNISSHVKAEVAAAKVGVGVGFGCEFYMVPDIKQNTQKKYHLTVLARTQEGYKSLLQLVSASYAEGFFHEPTIDFALFRRYAGGLVVLSGCQGSLLFCSAVGGKHIDPADASYHRARKVAQWFRRVCDDGAYFLEVQAFPQLEKSCAFNPIAERLGRQLGLGLAATKDIHYVTPDQAEIQKVLHNVRPGERRTLEDMERDWGYDVELCPPISDRSIYRDLRRTGLSQKAALEAIANTELIGQACDVTLPKLPMVEFPLPRGYSAIGDLIRDWLRDGWRYRGCHLLPYEQRKRYKERLRYELEIIESKGFLDYFAVVADGVRYVKELGLAVGPARGSAAASLLCWLLRITEVNPMLFPNLVFERFIDVSREDLPDIDLDFSEEARAAAYSFLVGKYGVKSVGNIGTFTQYKAKLALDDVGKVHRIPRIAVETVKEVLVERSSGDLRASATIEDTIAHFEEAAKVVEKYPELRKAADLEGNVKTFGVHAAGLAVATGDIRDVCALYERTMGDGRVVQVVSMDKYDAERQGLLKLDYLALSTLDMITMALGYIGMSLEDLYRIKLDDPEALRGFRENDVVGVFQYDGRAARSVNQALETSTFNEVCDVIALCRPGPLHSGAAGDYIEIKHGRKPRASIHPRLDLITDATHGQIVYQEQILRVVVEIGDFDWTSASAIRRIMSKKEGSAKFNRAWKDFWAGAKEYHKRYPGEPPFTQELARAIWNRLITAGAYAFNFAHCVSYGMIGLWSMWIKRHYPEIFYASALAKLPEGKKKVPTQWEALKLDALRKGIELKPPSPRKPTITWTPGKGYIRGGIVQVHGLGEKVAPKFIELHQSWSPLKRKRASWNDYKEIRGVGPAAIEKLTAIGRSSDPYGVQALPRLLDGVRSELQSLGLPTTTHLGKDIPYERSQDTAICWLGIVKERNLRDIFESHRAKTGEELDPTEVRDPELRELVVLTCYDGTEVVTVRFTRYKYPQFKRAIWGMRMERDVILVEGVKPGWRTAREIYANKMWVINPEG